MRLAGRPTGVGAGEDKDEKERVRREGAREDKEGKEGKERLRREGTEEGARGREQRMEGTKERGGREVINEGTIGNNDSEGEARGSETDKIAARLGAFIWNETAGKARKGAWERTIETGRFEEAERRDGFVDLSRTAGSASATSYPPLRRGDVGLFHTP
ncbi:hypothetical protein V492_06228 [Pseudogymnoascus sp. VKM F-4246]|nr:hypothetical protein V492_06228 [Pseudogymnoascus sp. VKM F-4246]